MTQGCAIYLLNPLDRRAAFPASGRRFRRVRDPLSIFSSSAAVEGRTRPASRSELCDDLWF
jgi:hypothetical protein